MKVKSNSKNENIKRINEIYKVLKKNDFGYLIEENSFFRTFPFLRNEKYEKDENAKDQIPIRMRKVFEELGPTYIKLGQMLSTRPDLVGIEVAEELQKLRDNTPTTPFDEMKEVIESELEKPLNDIYIDIDEEPIGSASIGQVYKAKLKSGEEVAIKVQKANCQQTIESDIKIMRFLAIRIDKYVSKTKIFNLPVLVNEFERSILKEINYQQEVRNMQNLSRNFENVEYIKIPEVYLDYCSEKVITMELIKGVEVTDLLEGDYPDIDKNEIAEYGVKSYFKQVMIDGFFHADPHSGNLIVTENHKLCYIDAGMMGILNEDFKENLVELMILLIGGNANNIIKQLLYMNIITSEQNTPELQEDINTLMSYYYHADLKNMEGLLTKLLHIMIKHNVVLPREFVLLGRGIALIENTGKQLDSNFNATIELKKLSRKIILNKYKPNKLTKGSINYLLQLGHLAKDLPDTINSTISKLEAGRLEVTLKHEGINELANQISLALIISALIIGSSSVLRDKIGPMIFNLPALGLIGFVLSAVLGAYWVIEYMIERT